MINFPRPGRDASTLRSRDRRRADRVLPSGWRSNGPEVAAFEREFATYIGADEAVAVSSGAAAVELSLRALRLPHGSRVALSTLAPCSVVQAVLRAGLRPVLLDVAADTGLVDGRARPRSRPQRPGARPRGRALGGRPVRGGAARRGGRGAGARRGRGRGTGCRRLARRTSPSVPQALPASASTPRPTCRSARAAWSPPTTPAGRPCSGSPASTASRRPRAGTSGTATSARTCSAREACSPASASRARRWVGTTSSDWSRASCDVRAWPAGTTRGSPASPVSHSRTARHPARASTPGSGTRCASSAPEPSATPSSGRLTGAGIGTVEPVLPLHRIAFCRDVCELPPTELSGADALVDQLVSLPIYPRISDVVVDRVSDVLEATLGQRRTA